MKLLRASRRALRAADPGSRTVLAGLPNESWIALRKIYKAGGHGAFDAVALHPYTGKPKQRDQADRVRAQGDAQARRPPQAGVADRAVVAGVEGQDRRAEGVRDDREAARRRG